MGSIADRMGGMGAPKKSGFGGSKSEPMGGEMHEGGGHSELHSHGDGTYHSVSPEGEKTEHPSFGHAAVHLAMQHEPEGAHSHVHHTEEGGHVSHHGKDGEVSGPHDHENLDALKSHMGKFLNEEEHEGHEGYGSPFED